METNILIKEIEAEWDIDQGFLGKFRLGIFDLDGFERLMKKLNSIQITNEKMIDRRLVSLIWYIPLFMTWQRERFCDQISEYTNIDQAINQATTIVETILGTP
jgi:hypothetical protein